MKRFYAYILLIIAGFLTFFWIATPADPDKQLITGLVFLLVTLAGVAIFIYRRLRK